MLQVPEIKKLLCVVLIIFVLIFPLAGADIPQHTSYYRIYSLIDELSGYGLTDPTSAVRPYGRKWIQQELEKVYRNAEAFKKLPGRLQQEIRFAIEDYAIEAKRLPAGNMSLWRTGESSATLWPPEYNHVSSDFQASIRPILGMHLIGNTSGIIDKRWFGASFHSYIGDYIALYGNLRDISHTGDGLLSKAAYLNLEPGYEYTQGTDYSESRGGIVLGTDRYSIALTKDQVIWGDNLNGSNILSGRTPPFPALSISLKPDDWFELNYFHGWLVSNLLDTTRYYLDNLDQRHYRPHKKYMAANLMTFTPFPRFKFSVGNAVVYAEDQPYPGFFIPIAFYKSVDHTTTKGLGAENQNAQFFFNLSSRNIKHLHLFSSVFVDEVQWRRFRPDSPDRNPVSYKLGATLTNFPIENLSFGVEYTRSNIINYKHSIPALSWANNSYNMGHYLGDNSGEWYMELLYKPIRGFDVKLFYVDAYKGNDYEYIRRGMFNGRRYTIIDIISNPSPGDIIWTNQTHGLHLSYEIFRNAYAITQVEYSNIRGHDAISEVVFGENRMTSHEVLATYTPEILHGKKLTLRIGFSLKY
jgi:hypothetical protein